MRFEFATSNRILFGEGVLNQVGRLATSLGRNALIIIGVPAGAPAESRAVSLVQDLHTAGLQTSLYPINGEPTVDSVSAGVEFGRQSACDLVIGFGGGSALDTAKAIAALLTNPGEILDYLEVIGRGQPITRPSYPMIAIPTTSGTGSEVTRNAVLNVPEQNAKVSLRSAWMLPSLAVVDPELTYGLPPAVTASTGLDALTQLIEPYVTAQSNPLTDAICREGLPRAARSLRRACLAGEDPAARADLSLASLFGGLALANAKLGAVHGFAAPLGGHYPAPHGAACARLLPFVMQANLQALRSRQPEAPALARYDEIGRILTGSAAAAAEDGVQWVEALCRDLSIPGLAAYGLTPAAIPALVEAAAQASSMQGNPIRLTPQEMTIRPGSGIAALAPGERLFDL